MNMKQILYDLYIVEKMSLTAIGKELRKNKKTVKTLLIKYKLYDASRHTNQKRDEFGRFIKEGQVLPAQIGENHHNYTTGKASYREKAFRELVNQCVYCGTTENLEVHHIDHNRENNDIRNLRIVCKNHHRTIEHKEQLNHRDENGRFIKLT